MCDLSLVYDGSGESETCSMVIESGPRNVIERWNGGNKTKTGKYTGY